MDEMDMNASNIDTVILLYPKFLIKTTSIRGTKITRNAETTSIINHITVTNPIRLTDLMLEQLRSYYSIDK
ncbi:MAG TPA: hypothetical protein VI278_11965 [Nitrososphaeraceae archaeon]|jgi:hypothetical protein